MRKIALFVMLFAGIAAFGGGVMAEASAQSAQSEKTTKKFFGKKIVTVKPGDTLSNIAKANDTTYTRLFDANLKIKDPDVIHPGDKVRIPHPEEKLKKRTLVTAVAPQATYEAPAPSPRSQPSYHVSSASGGAWDQLASCESGGNWSTNTGNGYYGGLQFSLSSWRAVGGSGYPHQASKSEQIARAEMLKARQGWGAWPSCSSKLALR